MSNPRGEVKRVVLGEGYPWVYPAERGGPYSAVRIYKSLDSDEQAELRDLDDITRIRLVAEILPTQKRRK